MGLILSTPFAVLRCAIFIRWRDYATTLILSISAVRFGAERLLPDHVGAARALNGPVEDVPRGVMVTMEG